MSALEKHPGGRPLAFKTVEELEEKIDEYFSWCDNRTMTIYDPKTHQEVLIVHPAPYTMSGLARRLGVDRRTLVNYAERDEYFPAIREARNRVQEDVENRLMETKNEKGAMFSLKNNFHWNDEPKIVNNIQNNTFMSLNEFWQKLDEEIQGEEIKGNE